MILSLARMAVALCPSLPQHWAFTLLLILVSTRQGKTYPFSLCFCLLVWVNISRTLIGNFIFPLFAAVDVLDAGQRGRAWASCAFSHTCVTSHSQSVCICKGQRDLVFAWADEWRQSGVMWWESGMGWIINAPCPAGPWEVGSALCVFQALLLFLVSAQPQRKSSLALSFIPWTSASTGGTCSSSVSRVMVVGHREIPSLFLHLAS